MQRCRKLAELHFAEFPLQRFHLVHWPFSFVARHKFDILFLMAAAHSLCLHFFFSRCRRRRLIGRCFLKLGFDERVFPTCATACTRCTFDFNLQSGPRSGYRPAKTLSIVDSKWHGNWYARSESDERVREAELDNDGSREKESDSKCHLLPAWHVLNMLLVLFRSRHQRQCRRLRPLVSTNPSTPVYKDRTNKLKMSLECWSNAKFRSFFTLCRVFFFKLNYIQTEMHTNRDHF